MLKYLVIEVLYLINDKYMILLYTTISLFLSHMFRQIYRLFELLLISLITPMERPGVRVRVWVCYRNVLQVLLERVIIRIDTQNSVYFLFQQKDILTHFWVCVCVGTIFIPYRHP
jgi:hypothetical protein